MKKNKDLHKNIDIKYDRNYIFSEFWASNPNYEGKKKIWNDFLIILFSSPSSLPPFFLSFLATFTVTKVIFQHFTFNHTWLLLTFNSEHIHQHLDLWKWSAHSSESVMFIRTWSLSVMLSCSTKTRSHHRYEVEFIVFFLLHSAQQPQIRLHEARFTAQSSLCLPDMYIYCFSRHSQKKDLSIETGSILTRYAGGGMFDTNRRLVTRWSSTDVQERRRQ